MHIITFETVLNLFHKINPLHCVYFWEGENENMLWTNDMVSIKHVYNNFKQATNAFHFPFMLLQKFHRLTFIHSIYLIFTTSYIEI